MFYNDGMKRFVYAIAVLPLILMILSLPASAGDTNSGRVIHAGELPESPEFAEAIDCVADILRLAEIEAEKVGVRELPESIPFDKAAKVFTPDRLLSEDGLFELAKTDEYTWIMPLAREKGVIYASIAVKAGRVTGYEVSSAADIASCGRALYVFDGGAVDRAVRESRLTPEEGAVFSLPDTDVDFAAFRAGGSAFAIPFCGEPEKLGLENGKLMPLDELIRVLAEYRGEPVPGAEAGAFPAWIPFAVCAACACVVIPILIRRRAGRTVK